MNPRAKVTDRLRVLAMYSGCDKRHGADGHGYVKYYEELFESMRSDPVNMMEIGIAKGRSQMMWAYYFRNGTIHCLDYRDRSSYFEGRDQEAGEGAVSRINPAIVDQSDIDALTEHAETNGPFDIVIDDGSHDPKHQILSFEALIGHTTKYYVIEDLHPYYAAQHGHETIRYFQNVVNNMNLWGLKRYYDINFQPQTQPIESVMFVPNAIIVRIRQNDDIL